MQQFLRKATNSHKEKTHSVEIQMHKIILRIIEYMPNTQKENVSSQKENVSVYVLEGVLIKQTKCSGWEWHTHKGSKRDIVQYKQCIHIKPTTMQISHFLYKKTMQTVQCLMNVPQKAHIKAGG